MAYILIFSEVKESNVPHIMISYQWDCQPIMVRVKDKLRQAGYKVWMDVEHMSKLSPGDGRRLWPLLVSSVPMRGQRTVKLIHILNLIPLLQPLYVA